MTRAAWHEQAACARLDPRTADWIFFGLPGRSGSGARPQVERARQICDGCPVLWQCLDDVLEVPEMYDRHGVRAGLLPDERNDLRQPIEDTLEAREQAAIRWLGEEVFARRHIRPSRRGVTLP